ncbi:MAG: cysteine desulfurase family protein [Patescibacteria group bacterium]
MRRIYLDYASLTPVDPRVTAEIKKYSTQEYANSSSLYKEGVSARTVIESSRKKVSDMLHALPDEIVFTSGGTEANGLALEGVGRAAHRNGFTKPHLIISDIEHSSIREYAAMMEKHGVEVTRVAVGADGIVSAEDIKKAIRPETFLVSIMYVNNEIGTVQPIREIAKVIRQARKEFSKEGEDRRYPLFHTDACQAPLHLDMNVSQLGVDMITLDGGKVYGPRGVGCLYVRRGTPIEPIMYGGGQERGLRSGTENVAGIAGFARALELATIMKEKESQRIGELRDFFIEELQKIKPGITVNPRVFSNSDRGVEDKDFSKIAKMAEVTRKVVTSPHILNVSIPGIDNEFLLFQLDAGGVAVSTKSSCLRDEDESYVLKALGADTTTSIRFSFGRWTKKGHICSTLKIVKKLLNK